MAAPLLIAGKIGLDLFAAGEAAKAQQANDIRNAQVAQTSRRIAGNRETQAYIQNIQNLREQNTADNLNVSLAEAKARDELAMATAGSGLAGASVDELSSEITRAVGRDRVAAKRSMDSQKDALNVQRIQSNENRIIEAQNTYVHNYSEDLKSAALSSVGGQLENIGKALML